MTVTANVKTPGSTGMNPKVPEVETILCPAWTDETTTHDLTNMGTTVRCIWCLETWADLDARVRGKG